MINASHTLLFLFRVDCRPAAERCGSHRRLSDYSLLTNLQTHKHIKHKRLLSLRPHIFTKDTEKHGRELRINDVCFKIYLLIDG